MKIKHFAMNTSYIPSKVKLAQIYPELRDEKIAEARAELIAKGRRITDFVALLKSANYDLTEGEIVKMAVEMYNAELIAEGMKHVDFGDRASLVTYTDI